MLQQSDWSKSNLYQLYTKHGRNLLLKEVNKPKNLNPSDIKNVSTVYTETELNYYIEFLQKIAMKKYRDSVTDTEIMKILEGHNVKSYLTL